MVWDIIKNGFNAITDSFKSFQGNGLVIILFLLSLVYLGFGRKEKYVKDGLVKYSVYVLLVFFCPLWYIYIYFFYDYEILYRILWLLPIGVVICYSLVDVISKFSEKIRPWAFLGAVLLIVVSGEFTFRNENFHPAENEYHIPQVVVDICDEISVEGREIRAAVPDELLPYVRQYTSMVCLPYGRETLMGSDVGWSELKMLLDADMVNTSEMAKMMRETDTPYLVVKNDKHFSESLSDYEFMYVTSIDEYDIYLDNQAYIGIDFINFV